jgi:hypothetical protein
MKAILKTAALAAFALAVSACQVDVDDNTEARLENAGAAIENAAESAAAKAGNAAEGAAATVENAADSIGNTDIDLDVRTDGNDAAANGAAAR